MWELFLSLDAMGGSNVKQTTRLPRLLSLSTKLQEHLKPSKKLSTAKQEDVLVSVIVLYFNNVPHLTEGSFLTFSQIILINILFLNSHISTLLYRKSMTFCVHEELSLSFLDTKLCLLPKFLCNMMNRECLKLSKFFWERCLFFANQSHCMYIQLPLQLR